MTPAQKARLTRQRKAEERKEQGIRNLAHDIRDAIAALPDDDAAPSKVPGIFRSIDATAEDKADAFRLLDEKPGLFPDYLRGNWYRTLRRCRNDPSLGLFAAINGKKGDA